MLLTINTEKLKLQFAYTDYKDLLFTLKRGMHELTDTFGIKNNFTIAQKDAIEMLSVFINCLEIRDSEISKCIANLIELTKEV